MFRTLFRFALGLLFALLLSAAVPGVGGCSAFGADLTRDAAAVAALKAASCPESDARCRKAKAALAVAAAVRPETVAARSADCQCGAACDCSPCRCARPAAIAIDANPPPAPMPKDRPTAVTWAKDYDTGIAAAKRDGRPILTLVTSPTSCPACRRLEAGALANKDVVAELQSWECVRIDASADPAFTARLGVKLIPTTILATPKGVIVETVEGDLTAADLLAKLKAAEKVAAK